jgi:acyl-CoA synthetase (AMP-forming)/AMP-acid ligase II
MREINEMQIGSLIRLAALHYGEAPRLTEGDRTLNFRDFDAATDRLGNALHKRPKSIEIWPDLPKSGANKILRRVVRDKLLADLSGKAVS